MTESVQALVTLQTYQQSRAHLFPSIESLRWFVRQQKHALVGAGALLFVAGRHMIAPAEFDTCVIEIGKQGASRRMGVAA